LDFVSRDRLEGLAWGGILVQPRIDFRYEVSFTFLQARTRS